MIARSLVTLQNIVGSRKMTMKFFLENKEGEENEKEVTLFMHVNLLHKEMRVLGI